MQGGKQKGTLTKWFDEKGFGFIVPDMSPTTEVFVHYRSINGDRPVGGETVEFDVITDQQRNKPRANNVVILSPGSGPIRGGGMGGGMGGMGGMGGGMAGMGGGMGAMGGMGGMGGGMAGMGGMPQGMNMWQQLQQQQQQPQYPHQNQQY